MEQKTNLRGIGKNALIVFFVLVILLSAVAETLICRVERSGSISF